MSETFAGTDRATAPGGLWRLKTEVLDNLREQLAALEHEQWTHWTRHLLAHLTPENVERWRRQCETPYEELSEAEKDRDREWADRVLALIRASNTAAGAGNS